VLAGLMAKVGDLAADWRKEDVAAITALHHQRLAQFMETMTEAEVSTKTIDPCQSVFPDVVTNDGRLGTGRAAGFAKLWIRSNERPRADRIGCRPAAILV